MHLDLYKILARFSNQNQNRLCSEKLVRKYMFTLRNPFEADVAICIRKLKSHPTLDIKNFR